MKTLLIVDAEPIYCDFFYTILSGSHNVFTTTTGQEALEVLENMRIDILLADIDLYGMDGIELLQRANDLDPTIMPVLMSHDEQVRQLSHAIGIRFVKKPLDIIALRSFVHALA